MPMLEDLTALILAVADFATEAEEEDSRPEDQFSEADDAAWARAQLASGNLWGWCCVRVTASWMGFTGVNYLGGCSYRSRADFCTPDGYWPDMKSEAARYIAMQIMASVRALEALGYRVTPC